MCCGTARSCRLRPACGRRCRKPTKQMAEAALRVLGLAYRDLQARRRRRTAKRTRRSSSIFVGLAGMIDPPRKEVRDAIATCRQAGIKTVMITGDHRLTAEAIASQLGILPRGRPVADRPAARGDDDEQLDRVVDDIYVYARVSPEHKLRIVKALQRAGHVVAMTGDGVNDAPAIKAADIGIAMGITGTDVSKEASSLVLSDDNFATIVAAIEEGRGIYENIRKFIRYLLASNVGEILTMFLAMMFGLPLPLVPIQILWVNLVTDGLPAMALGVDQPEKDLMQHKPRAAKENIFARRLGWKIISRGLLIGLCTLARSADAAVEPAIRSSCPGADGRVRHAGHGPAHPCVRLPQLALDFPPQSAGKPLSGAGRAVFTRAACSRCCTSSRCSRSSRRCRSVSAIGRSCSWSPASRRS